MDKKAKCRHLKKFSKWTAAGVYLSAHCTLYTSIVHTGKRGGGERVELERRLEGQQFTKLGRKYQNGWPYLQYINSDKHLHKVPLQVNFFMATFCFGVYILDYSTIVLQSVLNKICWYRALCLAKQLVLSNFCLLLFDGTFTSFCKDKNHKEVTKQ